MRNLITATGMLAGLGLLAMSAPVSATALSCVTGNNTITVDSSSGCVPVPGQNDDNVDESALVFIPVSGEYLVPHFIGEGKVTVVGTLIVQNFMERRNWPYAAACAMWLLGIVLVPLVLSMFNRDVQRGSAR